MATVFSGLCWIVSVTHLPNLTEVCLDRAAFENRIHFLIHSCGYDDERVRFKRMTAVASKPNIVEAINA